MEAELAELQSNCVVNANEPLGRTRRRSLRVRSPILVSEESETAKVFWSKWSECGLLPSIKNGRLFFPHGRRMPMPKNEPTNSPRSTLWQGVSRFPFAGPPTVAVLTDTSKLQLFQGKFGELWLGFAVCTPFPASTPRFRAWLLPFAAFGNRPECCVFLFGLNTA